MTPARKALAAAVLAVTLFAAVIVQLTVVNRLPFPTGAVPDLVLLLVTAIAVTTTPALAAVTGFAGGLALDVAPPAAHYAGEYALVFCLAAYVAARVSRAVSDRAGERDAVTAFTVMAVAAAAGEAGKAALGMLLSDPNVTTAAASRVLPGAILYDLILSPFAFWLVALVTRPAARSADSGRAPAPAFSRGQRPAAAFRQASAGAAPRLHLAGTGADYATRPSGRRVPRLRLAGTGMSFPAQPPPGRVPNLRLSRGGARSVPRTAAGLPGGSSAPLAARRTRKLSFGGDLPVRAGARPARTPGRNWLRSAASPALVTAQRPSRGPSRGWLRRGAGGTPAANAGTAAGFPARRRGRRPRRFAAGKPGAARTGALLSASRAVPRTSAEALAARSAPSGLSALSGAGAPLAGRAPRAGWLSGGRGAPAPAVRKNPRTGWLGGPRRPRTVIGSTVRGRVPVSSAAAGDGGNRRYVARLLQAMGVGK